MDKFHKTKERKVLKNHDIQDESELSSFTQARILLAII